MPGYAGSVSKLVFLGVGCYDRQLGATFVVGKGGEMLLDFRQRDFADQPSTVSILDALGLDSSDVKEERAAPAVCTD
jgi:hypothetical protein